MIKMTANGDFRNIEKFLDAAKKGKQFSTLNNYGRLGVEALASATPVDSGLTASSWTYEVKSAKGRYSISWHNTNRENGAPVAILLQYGHATGTGGWVEGRDYINPALHPLFDQLANDVWEQVIRG
jgi:hypothetical protein